jgi:hypothetical protein
VRSEELVIFHMFSVPRIGYLHITFGLPCSGELEKKKGWSHKLVTLRRLPCTSLESTWRYSRLYSGYPAEQGNLNVEVFDRGSHLYRHAQGDNREHFRILVGFYSGHALEL